MLIDTTKPITARTCPVTRASGPCARRSNVTRFIIRALPYLCASAFI
jgi:hypothetical protein